ncbi:hypothetical protein O181_116899 [Austropuccinia psidii MF-1]|uniref:Uncharacterized protein n=1 Tax=Austropuccinia psidii MF-1 TaxID=1389203 RepID=A0A9Q3K9Q2_9BASI|nr:hypothetical protein [Austropuccinia psidii MF-1]
MEASTIEVEPVQKKGLKPKQLVKSVSNKYGKNGTYWKKKKDAISNEEYCNDSKMKGSSKIKRYFSKIISKIKNNHKSEVQWDFQCPGAQPTILEEINPTKIENSITELEVEPTNQKLETNLSEEGSIQSQEPLGLDQEIKKLNFMELEIESSTGSIGSDNSQNNSFANLSLNCGLNSPIYVRVGWEEYPVMAIMNPSLEENILPLKIGLCIGMKPKKKNKTKNKILMKKVQIVMPTDETIYLPFTVEGSSNHLILGKKFYIEIEEEGFSHSKEEEEVEESLSTFTVNTFHSKGIYVTEHTHAVNEDFLEENQEFFNIKKSKVFNLFDRDKKEIQETLASESDLFIEGIPDLFYGLCNQGNSLNNTHTFAKPEEEIQALLEEIFKGNPWDNELLSQPQSSITQQEVPPVFIQKFKQNSNINPQDSHFQVKIHEPSNYEVKFSKEMNKKPFKGILKKEYDENQPFTPSKQTDQDQLTSEEKEILKLYDAFFNMGNQQFETTNLAQRLELNNSQLPQENIIHSGQMSGILHDNTSNQLIHISRERKVTRNTKIRKFSISNQNNEHTTRNKIEVNLKLTYNYPQEKISLPLRVLKHKIKNQLFNFLIINLKVKFLLNLKDIRQKGDQSLNPKGGLCINPIILL